MFTSRSAKFSALNGSTNCAATPVSQPSPLSVLFRRYCAAVGGLWVIFTIFFAGTSHLPWVGEVIERRPLGGDLAEIPKPSLVSSWHYPNVCDAALQRSRPFVMKYLTEVIGECPRTNGAVLLTVPSTYGLVQDGVGDEKDHNEAAALMGDGMNGFYCSFVLQSSNKQRGWALPTSFSLEELKIADTLRHRILAPLAPSGMRQLDSKSPHIYVFFEEDVITIDECMFVKSSAWKDAVTFVTYNAQASNSDKDPLLVNAYAARGMRPPPARHPVDGFMGGGLPSIFPRIINVPHRYEWGTTIPGPITPNSMETYLPSDLFSEVKRVDAKRSKRGDRSGGSVALSSLLLGADYALNVGKRYRIVWRGVTTGRFPFASSDRYRAVMALQKEQLRRTLESTPAKDMLTTRWRSEVAGGTADGSLSHQLINNMSDYQFPIIDFADVCFTRIVQGTPPATLALAVRPSRKGASRSYIAEGMDTGKDVYGSYFVIQDNYTAPVKRKTAVVTVGYNGKDNCASQSPEALLRSGMIHLDVDGNGNAWEGLRWKLCAGAVIIKISSSYNFYQWYYDKLVNGTHLIIVHSDAIERDLVSAVDTLARDEALMAKLSQNALAFCQDHLQPSGVEEYYAHAFD